MKRTVITLAFSLIAWVLLAPAVLRQNREVRAAEAPPPPFVDADGDGIPDSLETSGFEIEYPDGSRETLKSSPQHKDIFVFVAWMADSSHSHKPNPAAISTVISSFDNSPIENIDKASGITLHVIYAHEPVSEQATLGNLHGDIYDWTAFNGIKSKVFPHLTNGQGARLDQFVHFCLFAHNYSPDESSGLTNTTPGLPGSDFMVTLGGFTDPQSSLPIGTPAQQAGTFMHELGHALGLRHGGNDDVNYKPNFISIMNYLFQMDGIQVDGNASYTYSDFSLDSDERQLSPALTSDTGLSRFATQFYCPNANPNANQSRFVSALTDKVDWKCDGVFPTRVAADVNADGDLTLLPGRNDWSSMQLVFASSSAIAGIRPPVKVIAEITPTEFDAIRKFPIEGVSAKRSGLGIQVAWNARPLGQIVTYVVYRKLAGEGDPTPIATTTGSSFLDLTSVAAGAQYFVSGLFAPASQKVQFGSTSGTRFASNISASQLDLALVQQNDFSEVAGLPSHFSPEKNKSLLKTDLSQAAVVR